MHCNSIFINPFCILKVTYYDKLLDTAEYSCVKNNGIREELHQVENRRFWSLCQLNISGNSLFLHKTFS